MWADNWVILLFVVISCSSSFHHNYPYMCSLFPPKKKGGNIRFFLLIIYRLDRNICHFHARQQQQQLWSLYIAHRCTDFASLEPLRLIEAVAWIERSYFGSTLAFGEVIVSSWAFFFNHQREKDFNETRKKNGRDETTSYTVQKTDVLVGERGDAGRERRRTPDSPHSVRKSSFVKHF